MMNTAGAESTRAAVNALFTVNDVAQLLKVNRQDGA